MWLTRKSGESGWVSHKQLLTTRLSRWETSGVPLDCRELSKGVVLGAVLGAGSVLTSSSAKQLPAAVSWSSSGWLDGYCACKAEGSNTQ
jgi:hypothetical protein